MCVIVVSRTVLRSNHRQQVKLTLLSHVGIWQPPAIL